MQATHLLDADFLEDTRWRIARERMAKFLLTATPLAIKSGRRLETCQRRFIGLAWDLHMHAAPCKHHANTMQILCKYHARKSCSDFCDMQVNIMQAPVLACICICKPMQANASPMQVPSFIMQTHETEPNHSQCCQMLKRSIQKWLDRSPACVYMCQCCV